VAEAVTGISAEFPLPPIATQAFSAWFARHEPEPEAGRAGRVALFPTCYGEFNFPGVPQAAVRVLEKNGYAVELPDDLTCCGMPNLDGGDLDAARAKMQRNVAALSPYVARGLSIVTPGPTCGYTMKKEWGGYVGNDEARAVSAATLDLMEFLDRLRRKQALSKDFRRGYGKLAYHAACHLRAQKIAIPGARVLSQLPNTEVRIIERCSAVDGTWGMKAAYYAEGARYASRLGDAIESGVEDGERGVVTDCSLAALRILKQSGRTARHPIELLSDAYFGETAEDTGLRAQRRETEDA
jgi:glycerol-3-phosphate dehydrogenase subunit C